ncbi:MAG: hypothetical protein WDW38_003888 [Sanguina aurantia]
MVSRTSVVALLATVLAVCLGPASVSALPITDFDIVQFALNLEYLEANFYSCAVYGVPISSSLTGGGPAPTGCQKAILSPEAYAYAKDIATDEIAHVAFLRTALMSFNVTPVAQPQIDIGVAFANAANAAFNATLSPSFSPYGSDVPFFLGSYIFEDVGATAYLGALPLIQNNGVLSAAAAIMAVEAYHAGATRTKLYASINEYLFPYGVTTGTIISKISALRDAAGKTKIDAGLLVHGKLNLVPVDKNSLLYSRTPAQVLAIVSLGGAGNKGGFFPMGMNGNIA